LGDHVDGGGRDRDGTLTGGHSGELGLVRQLDHRIHDLVVQPEEGAEAALEGRRRGGRGEGEEREGSGRGRRNGGEKEEREKRGRESGGLLTTKFLASMTLVWLAVLVSFIFFRHLPISFLETLVRPQISANEEARKRRTGFIFF
jgi:hypothetical protein